MIIILNHSLKNMIYNIFNDFNYMRNALFELDNGTKNMRNVVWNLIH